LKFTIDQFLGELPLPANEKWKLGVWDIEPHAVDDVRLVFFAPRGEDFQTSHEEDEYYFIARGSGFISIGDRREKFEAGDAFFVEREVPHRLEEFSDDFATWAIFISRQRRDADNPPPLQ
jgi:mannose-6-phosphate isomerase-like protein (cupin superfamily)